MSRIWVASIGRNGRNSDAAAIDSMLPKFELDPMRTYFRMLANVRRPSSTPSATTAKSESSRIMSAAARATPVAPATDRPTSAAFRPGASFTPSPMKPTISPDARRAWTIRTF